MNKKMIYKTLVALASYKIFKKRTPLIVSFLSTYTCNQKCKYCDWTKMDHKEISTESAIKLISNFKKHGVLKLGFAGGESLNRKDINQLLKCSYEQGLITSISSNGREVINHIDAISKYVDVVQISLDGTQTIHDDLRGQGSYDNVIRSIEALRNRDVNVITNTVLTKRNIKDIDHVIYIAQTYKLKALFQPVFSYGLSESIKEINKIRPSYVEMYNAINRIEYLKRKTNCVGNSMSFLRYIKRIENDGHINCYAQKLFCCVDPLGYVNPCCFYSNRCEANNAFKVGFKNAFINGSKDKNVDSCKGCFCNAYIESNLIFDFDLSAIINALGIV